MPPVDPILAPPLSAKMPLSRRLWKISKRLLRSLALIYLLVGIAMYAFQTHLVFPGASTQNSADAQIRPAADEELIHLKASDGTALSAFFGKADPPRPSKNQPAARPPASDPRPTILYFYGNAECMASATFVTDRFRAMGYHCMLVDYQGYGLSGGAASEQGCYAAAEAAYQYAITRPDVERTRLIAAGWSLGGAVAIDLVWRHRDDHTFCGLMTFSSFTSMVALGQHLYPFLPVGLVLKHRFMSIDKIGQIRVPYFNGHGRHDSMIPFAFAGQLTQAAATPGDRITRFISESDHNDFFDIDSDGLNRAMETFLAGATRAGGK